MPPKKRLRPKKPEPQKVPNEKGVLEIVLKSDVAGTLEAVNASLSYIRAPNVEIVVIQAGVGPVSKSDILMARTGSRLIVGFNISVAPHIQKAAVENGVEIRLYEVIYKLSRDLAEIAKGLTPASPKEKITGKADVIATFKRRRGIIIGCEVTAGIIKKGDRFRVITAMGPAYSSKIESLQIEKQPVKRGTIGQQVGIGITGWEKAKIGDLVECYDIVDAGSRPWQPKPGVSYLNT